MLANIAIAQDTQQASFWERKSEGWFWYETEPEPAPEEEEPLPEPVVVAQPAESAPPLPEEPVAPPPTFSAAWVRENIQRYKDLAWDNPTIENVRAFLYLQRFAFDRSEEFSDVAELAVIGDPLLDEISRRPSATFASQHLDSEAGKARGEILQEVAKKVGVFFFFHSECDLCEHQAPLMKMLEQSAGFSVVPISMDGKALPSNLFKNTRVDNGHAKRMNVLSFPAVYLVSPDDNYESIGQGLMSLPELNYRILVAAKRNGWVSEDVFNKTRPILNLDKNIARNIDQEALPHLTDEEGFIPPGQLTQYMKNKMKGR